MTPEAQVALIVALPPTVTALGAILVTILAYQKSGVKLDQIHVLTNSTLTAANKRIDDLEKLVKRLLEERREN